MLSELPRAILEIGLPVAVLSWLLFYRLYSRGELARDADRKAIGASLKSIRKAQKESKQSSDSLLHAKWMKFGGGFYGVAAAWTLLYIEASGVIGVIAHPSTVQDMFRNGIGGFIAQQISGQVSTFVDAVTWFNWWPGRGHNPIVWFGVAYAAYIAGLELARFETRIGSRAVELDSRERWASMVPFRKDSASAPKEEEAARPGEADEIK
ncbi:MAG: hypothetical protein DYH18_06470 [Xanthomonadales bacterium PRO7]|nr:hypothetical protein [Xanthomonadales bacterium PRO7]